MTPSRRRAHLCSESSGYRHCGRTQTVRIRSCLRLQEKCLVLSRRRRHLRAEIVQGLVNPRLRPACGYLMPDVPPTQEMRNLYRRSTRPGRFAMRPVAREERCASPKEQASETCNKFMTIPPSVAYLTLCSVRTAYLRGAGFRMRQYWP